MEVQPGLAWLRGCEAGACGREMNIQLSGNSSVGHFTCVYVQYTNNACVSEPLQPFFRCAHSCDDTAILPFPMDHLVAPTQAAFVPGANMHPLSTFRLCPHFQEGKRDT